jgi:PPK2 family polyphosphate:nucleotide phosphotransferase
MDRYRVKPGSHVDLSEWDPDDHSGFDGDKDAAESKLRELNHQTSALQELLYAEHKHKLLIVLQGMDTSGKDGTIRHVFAGVNPSGVRVASYKAPTQQELDHDFLWRVHKQAPAAGEIAVFNRSHYEDVLVVRVHNLVPSSVWKKRYPEINQFEEMLANEGTTILKFFLHIDREEQKKRLEERLKDPAKHWKFNPEDLKERKLWPDYMRAYQDAIGETSTEWAPWYIVPSNHKWYRDFIVSTVVIKTLGDLKMQYPRPEVDLSRIKIE